MLKLCFMALTALLVTGCAAAVPTASPTNPIGSVPPTGQLVVNSCGGSYGEAIQEAYVAPFEAETDVDVVYDENCDDQTTKLAAQVEAGQVQWDVIGGFGGPVYQGLHDDGLLMTIDHAALGSAEMALSEGATQPFGLGFHHDGVVLGYRASAFPGQTPVVADFFDLAAFPGRRGMTAGGFEDWTRPALALVVDGVAPADLIPLDWDRAYAKLETVKPGLVFWRGGTEMVTVMLEDQAQMCLCGDARMLQAQREDPDIRLSFDGALRTMLYWAVPQGAPHEAAAMAFLASTLRPERQARFTELVGYSGIVESSFELLPDELQSQVLGGPENLPLTWSFTAEQNVWLADHASEASERYATWVGE
jgi:putative spermidine/putrescine transport system substrate-binding protein